MVMSTKVIQIIITDHYAISITTHYEVCNNRPSVQKNALLFSTKKLIIAEGCLISKSSWCAKCWHGSFNKVLVSVIQSFCLVKNQKSQYYNKLVSPTISLKGNILRDINAITGNRVGSKQISHRIRGGATLDDCETLADFFNECFTKICGNNLEQLDQTARKINFHKP